MGSLVFHIRTDVEALRGSHCGMTKLVLDCQRISAFEMQECACGVPDVLPGKFVRVDFQGFEQGLEWLMNIPMLIGEAIGFYKNPIIGPLRGRGRSLVVTHPGDEV